MTAERNSLLASVSMKPNRAGPNLLSVQVVDTRRPAPAPIESVTVLLQRPGASAPESFRTTRSGDRYDAGAVSMATGDVRVSVVINRTGLGPAVVEVPWRVYPPEVQRVPTVISAEPLAPLVNLAALLLALLAALSFAAGLLLRSRAAGLGPSSPDGPRPTGTPPGGGRLLLSESGDGP
jgi:copper transport protein